MATNAAMFLFLAAGAVSLFIFLSIAAWVGAQAEERKTRDKLALLKALAENPGENAQRVLDMLREQDEELAERRQREERKGFLVGGLVMVAAGVGVTLMMATLSPRSGTWTIGVILLLVGSVLAGFGIFAKPGTRRS